MTLVARTGVTGLFALLLLAPATCGAATLVNINTADKPTLETLPGIGPTLAQRIIDYRTQQGPFATTAAIQNVSGIGPTTYANIAGLITVNDSTPTPTPPVTPPSTPDPPPGASSTPSTTQERSSVRVAERRALPLDAGGDRLAFVHMPLRMKADAGRDASGANPRLSWSFGDGSTGKGPEVEKVYTESGEYLVIVEGTTGSQVGSAEFVVSVREPAAHVIAVTDAGIIVKNDTEERLDLSGWWIRSSEGSFRVPTRTVLLPNAQVLLPRSVTKLAKADGLDILYPDGTYFAGFSAPQPVAVAASSTSVQTVVPKPLYRPVVSNAPARVNSPARLPAQAAAPIAVAEPAAVGAALAATSSVAAAAAPLPEPASGGAWSSPWAWAGAVGAVLLAGAAFVFL